MLGALVNGVKGGVWFSLMDKVYKRSHLMAAFAKVKANQGSAGVDHVSIAMFEKRLTGEIDKLHEALRTGSYRPQAIRRAFIEKPGSKEKRPLGIPTVRDRVVQTALKNVLEPIFEVGFAEYSYGFRPGRGCKDGLRRVERLLKQGNLWVVDADIKGYFDTIPHKSLMVRVRGKIADSKALNLIESYLNQEIKEDQQSWVPKQGIPQGSVISPLLANIYLDPLDQWMAEHQLEMVRYADDQVILCRSQKEADEALAKLRWWMSKAGLKLHPEKTVVVDMTQPGAHFEFLGYQFQTSEKRYPKIERWPRGKSKKKLRESIKSYTKRCNGWSLENIIATLNPILKGWFEYYKHCNGFTFIDLDGWVRMRLRSILRKREKKKGRGRGSDHQKWPNVYFRNLGLFSMKTEALRLKSQSPRG